MKLLIIITALLLQRAEQGRLIKWERTHGNRFLCDFVTIKNDTLKGLPWYVPGLRKYTPELNAWHTIEFVNDSTVKIKLNK